MNASDVIERLCLLQTAVAEHIGFEHSADCFCGKGGFWGADRYDGTQMGGYRNDGKALEFIESAVRKAIADSKEKQQ